MDEEPKTPLDRWMRDKGCEDAALAEKLSLSRSQVNRLRRGVSKPPLGTAEVLAEITGIPALTLMKGSDGSQVAA